MSESIHHRPKSFVQHKKFDVEPTKPGGLFGHFKDIWTPFKIFLQIISENELSVLKIRSLCKNDRNAVDNLYFLNICLEMGIEPYDSSSPYVAYQKSLPSAYQVEMKSSVEGGSLRSFHRHELFTLQSQKELEVLIQNDFNNAWNLLFLLEYGMDMNLLVIQKGEIDSVSPLYLQQYMCIHFTNGSNIRFEDVQPKKSSSTAMDYDLEEYYGSDGCLRRIMVAEKSFYTICGSTEYECPFCSENTFSCGCFGEAGHSAANSPVHHVEFDKTCIPFLIGRPIRKNETLEIYGETVWYGHTDVYFGEHLGKDWNC